MSAGEAMADSGQSAEATALFATASGMWDALLARPRENAAGPPTTVSTPSASAPRVTPSLPVGDSAAIAGYYRELEQSIESRQVGEVLRLLPNLDRFVEDGWRRLFDDRNMEKIEASFTVTNVTRNEATAHARVEESLVITKSGKASPKVRTYFATLTLGPQGWRQIREDK